MNLVPISIVDVIGSVTLATDDGLRVIRGQTDTADVAVTLQDEDQGPVMVHNPGAGDMTVSAGSIGGLTSLTIPAKTSALLIPLSTGAWVVFETLYIE